ncbi:hypothetical protein IFM89_019989, partial [Coptis chinensis]
MPDKGTATTILILSVSDLILKLEYCSLFHNRLSSPKKSNGNGSNQ